MKVKYGTWGQEKIGHAPAEPYMGNELAIKCTRETLWHLVYKPPLLTCLILLHVSPLLSLSLYYGKSAWMYAHNII
jgi:hypothetical protein